MVRVLVLLFFGFLAVPALATDEPPKTFQTWKDLQVLEAQNQVLRVSARINQIKAGKAAGPAAKSPATHLPSQRVKTATDSDPLSTAEKDLRRAKESLETANGLDLSDYVSIYLPSLQSQPEQLQTLLQSLPKEELQEIVKMLLNSSPRFDNTRKMPVFSGIPAAPSSTN